MLTLGLWVVWQLISDAGYQGEITSVSTACQQLEVFSRVLRTSLATILDGGEENLEKNLPEFAVSPSESQVEGGCPGSGFERFPSPPPPPRLSRSENPSQNPFCLHLAL